MKKTFLILLALLFLFTALISVSCGGDDEAVKEEVAVATWMPCVHSFFLCVETLIPGYS